MRTSWSMCQILNLLELREENHTLILNSNYINRSLWLVQVCMRQKHKTQETSLYLYPGCFIQKQPNYELKRRYQLHGMASTLRMRTSTSPRQWKPWTAVSPLLGSSAWHSRRVNKRG